MSAAVDFAAAPAKRLCHKCWHYHGGEAFGLCLVPDCDCVRVEKRPRTDGEVSARTLVRRAAKAFAAFTDEERAKYVRASRHFDESDLKLEEFAEEAGLDQRLLWRVRRSLRRAPSAAIGGGLIPMANVDIDRDEKIADMLREGIQNRDIARILAVGHSEITRVRKELTRVRKELGLAGQTGGPRASAVPPPHVDRKAEPKEVATQVDCIVAGAEIGARECIARQCEQKCFCPKASFAINALTPLVLPGTRLEDQLASCRAVARSVLLKPLDERFLGPALQAFRGEKVEQSLIPGDLPAPPNHEPAPPVEVKPPPPAKEKAVPEEHGRSVLDAAPKTVDDVAKKHLRKSATPAPMVPPDRYVAPNVDIVQLLEQQHAHHTRELGRIGKALAALKE